MAFFVYIIDDGPGVPLEAVPHLFKKFYQSDDQTVKKRVGTGLGLAISDNIINIEHLKGQLAELDLRKTLATHPKAEHKTFTFKKRITQIMETTKRRP